MKRICIVCCMICVGHFASAQVANTTWTGAVSAGGDNINVTWKLAADTSYFIGTDDNNVLDVSTYKLTDSTITLKKVSGVTGCSSDEATYKFTITDKTIKLDMVKDDCYDRSGALDKVVFTKKEI